MIYIDDGATVNSIKTCSDTESADADHSDEEEPPLGQPSHTYTDGGEQTSSAKDTQDQMTENYFCTQGRTGSNDGWEFKEGWSKERITEKMATSQIPQPVLVKAKFARAQGQPGTRVVEEEWSEKWFSADHPSQARGLGLETC